MKKTVFIFVPFILFLVAGFAWLQVNLRPVSGDTSFKDVLITKGLSAYDIGAKLKESGLVRDALIFKLYVQLTGKQGKLFAGDFRLSPNMSLPQIVDALSKGPVEIWVTIPEGLRREEIADKFISGFGLGGTDADNFRTEFLSTSKNKEGFLFPDTYLFARTASASAIVVKMESTFDKKLTQQMQQDVAKSGYSMNEIITIASLIERETKTDAERPVVAGILYNRLAAGWPLQVDAAVQYAVANSNLKSKNSKLDEYWVPLTKADLEIVSPYNTYKNTGLPPTPIANPGILSIDAAIYPTGSDYMFYLHDTNGVIHYAKTIQEHNANIKKYLGG